MGDNPAMGRGPQRPLENVSWDKIVTSGGFLARAKDSPIRTHILAQTSLPSGVFRLPSETECTFAPGVQHIPEDGSPWDGDGPRQFGALCLQAVPFNRPLERDVDSLFQAVKPADGIDEHNLDAEFPPARNAK